MSLSWIGTVALVCVVGAAMFAGCSDAAKPAIAFDNASFYGPDGKFLPDKAKDAYIAVMKYHGYPVYPGIREKLWVSDYGLGKFTDVGLGCVMWMNNEKDHYMLMDIYLLPKQMLPEHWHEAGATNPAKREGWLIRYGLSHVVGEGEANLGADVKIPNIHMDGTVTVKHEVVAKPGDFVPLNREGAHHWQLAGPQGAIITEVANVHTGPAVRHADKAMNENFLKAQ